MTGRATHNVEQYLRGQTSWIDPSWPVFAEYLNVNKVCLQSLLQ